jgi:hypothetical protein
MSLVKHEIYKIYHNPQSFSDPFPRDYLLICPDKDVFIPNDYIKGKEFRNKLEWCEAAKYITFPCLFIICFDGSYTFDNVSSVSEDCYFEKLNNEDLKDIKDVLSHMNKMGEKYKYNRKLNRVIKL